MGTIRRLVAIWLLLMAAPALAQEPADALVTLKMVPDAVHASIELDHAVDRFAFADASVVREGDFEILTPGLILHGDEITAARPFRRFELRIKPASTERDAAYPAHYRLGAGGVVYAPALRGEETAWRTRFRFETAPGQIVLPSRSSGEGFVFIGPAGLRTEDADLILVADRDTPQWLVEKARTAQAAAIAAYARATGIALPRKPMLIVEHDPAGDNGIVGDVTPGFVTTVRFHGAAWASPDELAGTNIQSLLFHEAFHLWNGGLTSTGPEAPTWLHEGGAEYAAMLAGLETGLLSESDALAKLTDALLRCRSGLQREGDKGLARMDFLSNQVRYPCGMVLQWAADLHLREASEGSRTIMDAWAEMFRAALGRSSGEYGLADFYSAARIADPHAFVPASLLIDHDGPERWQALPAALDALGAEVDIAPPSAPAMRQTLLFHLLGQNCSERRFGFTTNAGSITLDSPEFCGALAGNPEVVSVEGGAVLDMSAATYAAVQEKCAAEAAVTFTTAEGRTLSARCAAPLAETPQGYAVKRWSPPTAAASSTHAPVPPATRR